MRLKAGSIKVWALILFAVLLLAVSLLSSAWGLAFSSANPAISGVSVQVPPPSNLLLEPDSTGSTPERIKAALSRGEIKKDVAYLYLAYALSSPEKVLPQFQSSIPWDGTLYLLDLQVSLRSTPPGVARSSLEIILSGQCGSSESSLPNVFTSPHFYIEYAAVEAGLTIQDYASSLEASWIKQMDDFGWAAPPVFQANPPPGNRYHVRVEDLGYGLYGYVSRSGAHAGYISDNPNTPWNEGDAYASCMVLNNDYTGFPSSAQASLDSTSAHELHHAIQYGYGAIDGGSDNAFVEGSATWMEDEVFDEANDNYNYLWPVFEACMGEYIYMPYQYWITFRGLTERFGSAASGSEQVMQDYWESASRNISTSLTALDAALSLKGSNLADAYHSYAIAVKFNKACGGNSTYPYCLEEGPDYVSKNGFTSVHGSIGAVGDSYTGSIPDNYALNWVRLPVDTNPYHVTLQNLSNGGQFRASVVCNTGSALQINPLPALVGPGATSTLAEFNPAGCVGVIAILTNQSQTAENPSACTNRSYRISLSPGGSSTPTPAPAPSPTPPIEPTVLGPPPVQVFYLPLLKESVR
jgi:hypothetical protein